MSEVKTVATRAAYGEALVELGKERNDFLTRPLPRLRRQVNSKMSSPKDFMIAE